MRNWSNVAMVLALIAVAVIEAAQAALSTAPKVAQYIPITSGMWNFAPLALLMLAGLFWIIEHLPHHQPASITDRWVSPPIGPAILVPSSPAPQLIPDAAIEILNIRDDEEVSLFHQVRGVSRSRERGNLHLRVLGDDGKWYRHGNPVWEGSEWTIRCQFGDPGKLGGIYKVIAIVGDNLTKEPLEKLPSFVESSKVFTVRRTKPDNSEVPAITTTNIEAIRSDDGAIHDPFDNNYDAKILPVVLGTFQNVPLSDADIREANNVTASITYEPADGPFLGVALYEVKKGLWVEDKTYRNHTSFRVDSIRKLLLAMQLASDDGFIAIENLSEDGHLVNPTRFDLPPGVDEWIVRVQFTIDGRINPRKYAFKLQPYASAVGAYCTVLSD